MLAAQTFEPTNLCLLATHWMPWRKSNRQLFYFLWVSHESESLYDELLVSAQS